MNINTNEVIENIELALQASINEQQKQLDLIKNSVSKAEEFITESDCLDGTSTDEKGDVLKEVMKTLKRIKTQISTGETDINYINTSIKSLEKVNAGINDTVIEQLQKNITEIKEKNQTYRNRIKKANDFLMKLLALEIICPNCGNGNLSETTNCRVCGGVGYINIANILKQENLLEVDAPIYTSEPNNLYMQDNMNNYRDYQNENNINNNGDRKQFVIRKK